MISHAETQLDKQQRVALAREIGSYRAGKGSIRLSLATPEEIAALRNSASTCSSKRTVSNSAGTNRNSSGEIADNRAVLEPIWGSDVSIFANRAVFFQEDQ
jgi:hypothetical protein